MGSQARPVFFCARPNGVLTPLIAMDELPTHIIIRGIPRNISPGETQGMISCGVAVPRPHPLIVDVPGSTVATGSNVQNVNWADAGEIEDLLAKVLDQEPISNHLRHDIEDALVRYTNSVQQVSRLPSRIVNMADCILKAANKPQKEYCSYWIRHGECDYAQQGVFDPAFSRVRYLLTWSGVGCLFKHEMPRDPALLARLGLRDIPKWYRDQYGVASIHEDPYGNYRPQLASTEQPGMRAIQYNTSNNAIGNGNGNNNNNAQYRGPTGRYRSPRGVGYPSRGRANHWQRSGNRMNIIQAPAMGAPASRSPDFSDQSWIDASPTTGIKNLNMEHVDLQDDGGVLLPTQQSLNKPGMYSDLRFVTGRLSLIGAEPMGSLALDDPQKPTYRTKSRRPWLKEHDGKRQSPDASPAGADEVNAPTLGPVNIQAAEAKDVKTATLVNAQAVDDNKVETATLVKASTPGAHDDSTVTSVNGSTTDAHENSTVTSVTGSIPNFIDYEPVTAARAPAPSPFGTRQLPRSAIAEMARASDPIIGKANMAIWTPIGEPVRRFPLNFSQAGFSNGSEFGW